MKKHTTRTLRALKSKKCISMLTCYDYSTANIYDESELDCILVGDSLGNVILGMEDTTSVTLTHMDIFSKAVRKGAPNKFIIADMPFGTYSTLEIGVKNAIKLFQDTKVDALKFEGASEENLKICKRLTEIGIPIVGHIGLQPQKVKEQGGYFTHGKELESKKRLLKEAMLLEQAGAFMIVLECIKEDVSLEITKSLGIPTIGIGSGKESVDGQVLVINDLLKESKSTPPSFCTPIENIYDLKKDRINQYLKNLQ